MLALFARHAQSEFNVQGLCNDDPAREVALTETGLAQARQCADALREVPLERIIVSQLPRTRQTAEIVNRNHGVPIDSHRAINDIRSGFDGRPVAEYFAAIRTNSLDTVPPGGESLRQHKQRVLGYVQWLRRQPEQVILTIAHEETLRVIVAYFEGLSDEQMLQLHFANCEIKRFELS
jgi:broad specificity phosphatase PhoE